MRQVHPPFQFGPISLEILTLAFGGLLCVGPDVGLVHIVSSEHLR